MAYYEEDEALSEIHDEMYRQEEERPKGGLAKLTPKSRRMLGLLAGALVLASFMEWITPKTAIIVGLAVAALILLSTTDGGRTELTNIECMIRLADQLDFIKKHPIGNEQIPPESEVTVHLRGRKMWYEGKSWKRSYGVSILDTEVNLEEWYLVEVDIFTGDIISFKLQPEGVIGDEKKDIKVIASRELSTSRRADKFMGKIK